MAERIMRFHTADKLLIIGIGIQRFFTYGNNTRTRCRGCYADALNNAADFAADFRKLFKLAAAFACRFTDVIKFPFYIVQAFFTLAQLVL